MLKKQWDVSNIEQSENLGTIEVQDIFGEYQTFNILNTKDRLVFGGMCNVGFLESGYFVKDDCFSLDENLQELLQELQVYYNQGGNYTTNIVYNERM